VNDLRRVSILILFCLTYYYLRIYRATILLAVCGSLVGSASRVLVAFPGLAVSLRYISTGGQGPDAVGLRSNSVDMNTALAPEILHRENSAGCRV
jgi:hypothetical protein